MTRKRQKYEYRAGIIDREEDWIWQGEVVAYNISHAEKILKTYQKKNLKTTGRIIVESHGKGKTNIKIGAYEI